jgi:hypothetical protein
VAVVIIETTISLKTKTAAIAMAVVMGISKTLKEKDLSF